MSKLDEAFLKAYAKVRDTGREKSADTSHPVRADIEAPKWSEPTKEVNSSSESWNEEDLLDLLRADDGVVNVASFIARTSNGRTRGTAQKPLGGVGEESKPHQPHAPESQGSPEFDVTNTRIQDADHILQGPHFQPISLDLAALDVFAPLAMLTMERTPLVAVAATGVQDVTIEAAQHFQAIVRAPSSAKPSSTATAHERIFVRKDDAHETKTQSEYPNQKDSLVGTLETVGFETVGGESHIDSRKSVTVPNADVKDLLDQTDEPIDPVNPTQPVRQDLGVDGQQEATAEVEVGSEDAVTAVSFTAAWEVDRFEFEDIIWELSAETSPLWQAVEQLEVACREGLKVLAVTSPARGQGRSTLSITLARMLAATGLNVALLDGDIDRPSLADKLRLEIRLGWGDAVRTGLTAEEVAVQSVDDGFTVVPSAPPDSTKAIRPDAEATADMMNHLRKAFDIVVIDTANVNVIGGWIPGADDGHIDAALVIQDVRHEDADAMQACLRRLQKIGINNIGLVENFANT